MLKARRANVEGWEGIKSAALNAMVEIEEGSVEAENSLRYLVENGLMEADEAALIFRRTRY